MIKNYNTTFDGPANKISNGQFQWFSFSLESGYKNKKIQFISSHLWLFGFQIFEICFKRIN